jgi:hypothetical protein
VVVAAARLEMIWKNGRFCEKVTRRENHLLRLPTGIGPGRVGVVDFHISFFAL